MSPSTPQHTRIEPRLLRQMTVRRVLDVLRSAGPSSRADLVRQTGISAPTISKAVASLLETGLVEEGAPGPQSLGRPGKLLSLATQTARVIGIALDGDETQLVGAGLDGSFDEETLSSFSTPSSYEELIDAIAERAAPLIRDDIDTLVIGISTPGLTDRNEQRVLLSPNLASTNGHSPSADLEARLGVPCFAIQESHALCLAEHSLGAARGTRNFAMIDAHVGLGLGVMQDGRLLLGHRGLAGELGHMTVEPEGQLCGCGNRGCLETRATDSALARAIAKRAGRELTISQALTLLDEQYYEYAAQAQRTTTWLSVAMSAVINLFNPAKLFVHSRYLQAREQAFSEAVSMTPPASAGSLERRVHDRTRPRHQTPRRRRRCDPTPLRRTKLVSPDPGACWQHEYRPANPRRPRDQPQSTSTTSAGCAQLPASSPSCAACLAKESIASCRLTGVSSSKSSSLNAPSRPSAAWTGASFSWAASWSPALASTRALARPPASAP